MALLFIVYWLRFFHGDVAHFLPRYGTPNCPSRGEIPKILKLAWGKAFVEVVAKRRLGCVWGRALFYY